MIFPLYRIKKLYNRQEMSQDQFSNSTSCVEDPFEVSQVQGRDRDKKEVEGKGQLLYQTFIQSNSALSVSFSWFSHAIYFLRAMSKTLYTKSWWVNQNLYDSRKEYSSHRHESHKNGMKNLHMYYIESSSQGSLSKMEKEAFEEKIFQR